MALFLLREVLTCIGDVCECEINKCFPHDTIER